MRRLLIACLAASVCAGTANAADLGGSLKDPGYAPPPFAGPPPFSWSGFYLGGQLGYGWGNTEADTGTIGSGFNQSYDYDPSGWLGGVHAGYNWQTGGVVLGLESDLELADIGETGRGTLGSSHTTEVDWMGSFRGRIGLASGQTLFYLTGGLAWADTTISSVAGSDNDMRTGWTFGGGLEQAIAPNMSARLEYRYTDFGTEDFSAGNLADRNDISNSAIRAGLSWRF